MKKQYLLILVAFSLTLGAVAQNTADSLPAKEVTWKIIRDSAYDIRYPANWTPDQTGTMGADFILFAPLESVSDSFKENINLQITDFGSPGVITPEAFAQAAGEQIVKMITKARIVQTQRKERDDSIYYEMEFTGVQGELDLHWKQQYWLKSQYAFILTFTAEESAYLRFLPLADKILGTFVLK